MFHSQNPHTPTPSRHPVLDTGLGCSSRGGAEGSQAPHQVRGDEAGWIKKTLSVRNVALAALALALSPNAAQAKNPPKAVRIYNQCVLDAFRNPGEETSDKYDEALDLAKAQCGNLRPAATEAVKKYFGPKLARSGDDPEDAAQALLDIMVGEQTATIWAEKHPDDVSHAR